MKKLLFIIACLFLIGCQTNDEPVENGGISEVEDQEEGIGEDNPSDEDTEEVKEDSDDNNEGEPSDEERDSSEQIGNEDGSYSSDDAIVLVQEFVQGAELDTELNYSFDGEDDQGNYRIQVFEVVDHGEETAHTATYGWYLVNPETGEVTDMMTQ